LSTSIVHVLTVIGKSAAEVEAACEDLLGRRIVSSAKSYGSSDWTDRDHEDIEKFCMSLLGAAGNLPIYYYAQYLDLDQANPPCFGAVRN